MRHELVGAHPNILIIQMYGNEVDKVAEFAALSGAEVVIPLGPSWPKGMVTVPTTGEQRVDAMARHLAEMSPKAYFMKDMVPGKWYEIGTKMCTI